MDIWGLFGTLAHILKRHYSTVVDLVQPIFSVNFPVIVYVKVHKKLSSLKIFVVVYLCKIYIGNAQQE